MRGRGSQRNPANRFERIELVPDEDLDPQERPAPRTQFLRDTTRSIIAWNDSPDLGFDAGVNPYRGCEHGCAYCYARPSHEFLGMSAGLDFETRIMVKHDAPGLLREALSSRSWIPQVIMMSGITDCYQPIERQLELTRGCLQVLAEFRNPVSMITKNHLITRDLDIMRGMTEWNGISTCLSVTSLDPELSRKLEPRASVPARRLDAIHRLSQAGVPVGVMVAPVIPGLNDHEIPAILKEAAEAGAGYAGYVMLRLPHGVKGVFADWLETHAPLRKEKVLHRVRGVREGKLNDARFGHRFRGEGPYAEQLDFLFRQVCRKTGLDRPRPPLSADAFEVPRAARQLELF